MAMSWLFRQFSPHLEPAAPARPPAPRAAPPAVAGSSRPWWTLDLLRDLDAPRLESVIHTYWQVRGFLVEQVGADLIITQRLTGQLHAVALCQPAHADRVSWNLVQGLADHVRQRGAPIGLFYGMPGFSQVALAFARGMPIRLITAGELLAEIAALAAPQQQALLDRSLRPASPAPGAVVP